MSGSISETVRFSLQDLTHRLRQKLGDALLEVRLFGSHARGEARSDSDVDVLVLVREASLGVRRLVSTVAADVGLDHDLVISTLTWDSGYLRQQEEIDTLLVRRLRSEGVVLWSRP